MGLMVAEYLQALADYVGVISQLTERLSKGEKVSRDAVVVAADSLRALQKSSVYFKKLGV